MLRGVESHCTEKYWCEGAYTKIWHCMVQSGILQKILGCGCVHLISVLHDGEWQCTENFGAWVCSLNLALHSED
jgi:hypothetical protein